MRSSFAILCVWLCFNVDASTTNGCSEIPEVENAELAQSSRKNNYSDGDKLDYNCKHGYASSLNITYKCRDNKWTKSHAENCSQATCPLNKTVEDSKIERFPDIKGPVEQGHKLTFSCIGQGLILKGQREITCQSNGEWSSPFPKCEEIKCVAKLPVNMRSDATEDGPLETEISIRPGHTITLSCVGKGTKLQGERKIICLSSGEWNVPFPKCVRGCSEIPEVQNAEVSQSSRKDNYSNGDTLDYNCKHGHVSPQKIIYICSKDKWIKLRGEKCSPKRCELPEDIPNGRYTIVIGSNFVFGTTIKYICREGYQMMSRFDTRTCRDGGWDNQLPVCEAISCVPDQIEENMRVEGLPDYDELIRYGHRLTFSCVGHGQILQGPKEITCQSNGQWSSPFPKCEVKRCELPEDIPNGRYTIVIGSNFVFGTTIKYICREGYQMMSRFDTRTCRIDGWDNQLPVCEEVMCVANLPANMRSDVTEVSIRPGHTIILSCVGKGTKLQGQRKITCLSSGEWNAPFPKCVGEKCERPPQVEFADTTEMIKPEYNSREKVEYICFHKYTLDVRPPYSKYLICEQGEWRGNIKCLKPCTVTVEEMDDRGIQLRWAKQEKIFSPHQDKITFACQRGKRLIGSNSNLIQHCNDGVMNLPKCV